MSKDREENPQEEGATKDWNRRRRCSSRRRTQSRPQTPHADLVDAATVPRTAHIRSRGTTDSVKAQPCHTKRVCNLKRIVINRTQESSDTGFPRSMSPDGTSSSYASRYLRGSRPEEGEYKHTADEYGVTTPVEPTQRRTPTRVFADCCHVAYVEGCTTSWGWLRSTARVGHTPRMATHVCVYLRFCLCMYTLILL